MYYCGYVGVVGRANAGKSSLINALVGQKVAIVSSKPQTTRNNILGIKNGKNYQIIFVDTPGIHPSKNHLDRFMNKSVRSAIAGVDLILYLIDGSKKTDDDELDYIQNLKNKGAKMLIIKTKHDKGDTLNIEADLSVSSVTGYNLEKLVDLILENINKSTKKNFVFDEDYYTDKNLKFLVAENIREFVLKNLNKEIPHGVAVVINKFEENQNLTVIEADIVCEKQSHKGIILGKGGQTIKKVGKEAREEIEKLLDCKVLLKLFVKVEEDWRNKPNQLNNLGYKD